jgi:hypothetical protein
VDNPDFDNIDLLADEVMSLADQLFPDRTDASMYLKLYAETAEVIDSDGAPDEIADIFILWLDYAARKNIDIAAAVRAKMKILEQRRWAKDANGVYSHIKEHKDA